MDDVGDVLRAGADKVGINTAALQRPELITEASDRFGRQCIVVSIDAKAEPGRGWQVRTHGGRRETGREATAWAAECQQRGAGELLVTSIDRDGTNEGYDLELTRAITESARVPVIASGGAGRPEHLVEVLERGGADAALVAGIVHRGEVAVNQLKSVLQGSGLAVRAGGATAASVES